MSDPCAAADALVARLREANTSPAVLFFLALPRSTLNSTSMGKLLLDLAEELGVRSFTSPFFQRVNECARDMRVSGDCFYVYAPKKDAAIQKFRDKLQRRREGAKGDRYAYLGCLMPFCCQFLLPKSKSGGSAFSGSLFFIFSTYELALRRCVTFLRTDFMGTVFTQLYELRLPDCFLPDSPCPHDRLGYLIIDWEVEESKLRREDGSMRIERREIEDLADGFALWFYRRLLDIGALSRDAVFSSEWRVFFFLFDSGKTF